MSKLLFGKYGPGANPVFFKQQPGADIEPGWYWVQPERGYPALSDKLHGPFQTKREAVAAYKGRVS